MGVVPGSVTSVRVLAVNDLWLLATPDSTPTAVLLRNGVNSGVTPGISFVALGRYTATWTNGDWDYGDTLELEVTTIYGGQSYVRIQWWSEVAPDYNQIVDQLQILTARSHQ